MAKKVVTKTASSSKEVQTKKRELFDLRMKVLTGEQKNTSLIRKAKKEIARMLTEQNKQDGK